MRLPPRLLAMTAVCCMLLVALVAITGSRSPDRVIDPAAGAPDPSASNVSSATPVDDANGSREQAEDGADDPVPDARIELTALRSVDEAVALVERLGGVVEVRSGQRVQVLVPASRVIELHAASDIVRVERPQAPVPLQAASAETELIGAQRWQAAGFTGHGVRVAVLDSGFSGYTAALGDTLPDNVETRSFRADGSIEGATDHGLRAAQIVHRVAPGADITLVNFATITELSAAVDYLVEQRVDVISFSLGYIHNGPGDGTGIVNEVVSRAADAGVAWSVAAGNWAQQHWAGTFRDTDNDSVHEFRPGVQKNGHFFNTGDLITVSVRWDDTWGGSCSDYDLELFGPDGALVGASRDLQDCSEDDDPVEGLQVLATQSGEYSVRVIEADAEAPHRLDLVVVGSPDRGHELDVFTPGGSLAEPADHPSVMTVGAIRSSEPRSEALFSSRGPTTDDRTKPDILAPVGTATETSEGFAGTSASAPHVGGVLALFAEAFPGRSATDLYGLAQLRSASVPDVEGGTPGARRVDTGDLEGLGPLLPEGGDEAVLVGDLPEGSGLAALVYRGPDEYPLRFMHLLLGGRNARGAYLFEVEEQRFRAYVPGAPAFVNDWNELNDGDITILRL